MLEATELAVTTTELVESACSEGAADARALVAKVVLAATAGVEVSTATEASAGAEVSTGAVEELTSTELEELELELDPPTVKSMQDS